MDILQLAVNITLATNFRGTKKNSVRWHQNEMLTTTAQRDHSILLTVSQDRVFKIIYWFKLKYGSSQNGTVYYKSLEITWTKSFYSQASSDRLANKPLKPNKSGHPYNCILNRGDQLLHHWFCFSFQMTLWGSFGCQPNGIQTEIKVSNLK